MPTIIGGCRSDGKTVAAIANPAANSATARSLARTIAPCAIGSGPRIEESRGSSDSASHDVTATSAITIIAQARNIRRSSTARIAVRPGDWSGMNRNFSDSPIVMNIVQDSSPAPTSDSTSCRSESGETRSFSRNRWTKCRVSSRSRTAGHHVGDLQGGLRGIGLEHQLGKDLLE